MRGKIFFKKTNQIIVLPWCLELEWFPLIPLHQAYQMYKALVDHDLQQEVGGCLKNFVLRYGSE